MAAPSNNSIYNWEDWYSKLPNARVFDAEGNEHMDVFWCDYLTGEMEKSVYNSVGVRVRVKIKAPAPLKIVFFG